MQKTDKPAGPAALLDKREHIATVTLNRPANGNAFNSEMQVLLAQIWEEIKHDVNVRCVILTGAGDKFFCAGVDVAQTAETGEVPVQGGFGSLHTDVHMTSRQTDVWRPVIAAVNGMCVGGGLHFVVDSDIVVASETATFFDAHVNIGQVGAIENIGLAKRVPLGMALRMTLQGRNFRVSAQRAYEVGLVDEVVPQAEVMDMANSIARDICANSPNAVSMSQRAVWTSVEMPYTQAVDHGYALLRVNWNHPDYLEGPRAWAEKRAPNWYTGTSRADDTDGRQVRGVRAGAPTDR